jgi:hypothetical protein
MKINPLATSIATIYLAPDSDAGSGGGNTPAPAPAAPASEPAPAPAVTADKSPTGLDIPRAPDRKQPEAKIIQPEPVKQKGIISVKKAFGLEENPSVMLTKKAKEYRAQQTKGDIEAPPVRKNTKSEDTAEPPPTPEPKVEEPKPAKPATPAPEAAPPTPAPKFKFRGKEMTTDEIAAELATLESKLGKAPETESATPSSTQAETPEQRAASEKARLDEYFKRGRQDFPMDQKRFDKILADGDVEEFAKFTLERELALRTWVEQTLNPILSDLQRGIQKSDGAVAAWNEVQQYRDEATFLEKNPDLRPRLESVRSVRNALATKYPNEWAKMSAEERDEETANAVRSIFGATTPAQATPAVPAAPATPTPTPKPPTPRPAPPTATLTSGGGGGSRPYNINSPQRLIAKGK